MDPLSSAAFTSWSFDTPVIAVLAATLLIYLRGWLAGRKLIHGRRDLERFYSFAGGLSALFLALESPLNSFDSFFLSAHMTQHLLLIMIAPPLLLLGQPLLPMLRGLPKSFVKEGLGPFLTSRVLHRLFAFVTSLPIAWLAAALSTILWHTPPLYELALSSPTWHSLQHATFFWTGMLFWWPLIKQGPRKARYPEWAFIPYLLFADMVNTGLSAFFVFAGRTIYPSYQVIRLGGINPVDDQALAGAIMWVPGSLVYLIPAFVLASRLLSIRTAASDAALIRRIPSQPASTPLFRAKQLPAFRRGAQWLMLALAIAVMADGFLGPQIAPLNLAGVLPWIYWRGLSVVALLTLGNVFCMSCPFTLVRDIARKIMPPRGRWPHALRNKWLPILLLAIYLWVYEAFGVWNSPWITAWIITGYFGAAILVDGFFQGASFCKYVCPIGQFHFVTSLVTPREVTVRSAAVCHTCRTHDCIRGNAAVRGCELDLFQPRKSSNLDCTFCMDCVKACPHDNVTLLRVLPARTVIKDPYRSSLGRLSKRTDWALLALLVVFGAFVNAAGMVEPVMMAEHRWHAHLGPHAMPLIVGLFVILGALVLPATLVCVCGALNHAVDKARPVLHFARRFSFALAPMGAAMWAAHLLYHLVTGWGAGTPALARAAGAHLPSAFVFTPQWLTPLQIVLLDGGLLLTLYLCWRISSLPIASSSRVFKTFAPWAILACSLYAAGIWILLQPMEMRGMMMQ